MLSVNAVTKKNSPRPSLIFTSRRLMISMLAITAPLPRCWRQQCHAAMPGRRCRRLATWTLAASRSRPSSFPGRDIGAPAVRRARDEGINSISPLPAPYRRAAHSAMMISMMRHLPFLRRMPLAAGEKWASISRSARHRRKYRAGQDLSGASGAAYWPYLVMPPFRPCHDRPARAGNTRTGGAPVNRRWAMNGRPLHKIR